MRVGRPRSQVIPSRWFPRTRKAAPACSRWRKPIADPCILYVKE